MTYKEALKELQMIVARVEGAEIDVDELAPAIRRANELIALCRSKLREAEQEVEHAIAETEAAATATLAAAQSNGHAA